MSEGNSADRQLKRGELHRESFDVLLAVQPNRENVAAPRPLQTLEQAACAPEIPLALSHQELAGSSPANSTRKYFATGVMLLDGAGSVARLIDLRATNIARRL